MNMETFWLYAPKVFVTLIGLAFVYELRKYKLNRDPAAWLRDIYAKTAKAAKNEDFRQSELADANRELAKYPVPNPIAPITNKEQIRLVGFPKMMFMSGLTGCVFIYLGLFETMPSGVKWPVYAGWVFLILTGAMYWSGEKIRPYYRRAQQLNRKYLLQKAGQDPERLDTMREVLEYYPTLPQLWVEFSDQLAVEGKFDEAIEAIRKARNMMPDEIDYPLVEASFHIRKKNAAAASKVLNEAEQMKRTASDPRIAIFKAAVALLNNEKKAAIRYGKEAVELDADFTEQLIKKDKSLEDLAALWEPIIQKKEEELFEEVAARQEMRKKEEENGEEKTV